MIIKNADVYTQDNVNGVQFIVVYSVYQVIIMGLKITVYTDNVENVYDVYIENNIEKEIQEWVNSLNLK